MNTNRFACLSSLFFVLGTAHAAAPMRKKHVKLVAQVEMAPAAKTETVQVKDATNAKPAAPANTARTAAEHHSIAITFSPFHAIGGVAEIAVEGKLGRRFGLAGIVGGGSSSVSKSTRAPLLEAGISPRWYLVGHFDHGLQLGAEVMGAMSWNDSATAVSVAGIPYVGYKVTAPVGFTFETQLGCGYRLALAQGGGASATKSEVAPLLNLNFGWAF